MAAPFACRVLAAQRLPGPQRRRGQSGVPGGLGKRIGCDVKIVGERLLAPHCHVETLAKTREPVISAANEADIGAKPLKNAAYCAFARSRLSASRRARAWSVAMSSGQP